MAEKRNREELTNTAGQPDSETRNEAGTDQARDTEIITVTNSGQTPIDLDGVRYGVGQEIEINKADLKGLRASGLRLTAKE